MSKHTPKKYHLDKRAAQVAENISADASDSLLCTKKLAHLLGVSASWLNQARSKGYGPMFVSLSPRKIVYRHSDVLAWLMERQHQSTAEYQS